MSALRATDASPGATVAVALEQSLAGVQPRFLWPAPPPATSGLTPAPATRGHDGPQAVRAKRGEGSRTGGGSRARSTTAAAKAGPAGAPRGTRIGVISDNHGYLDPAVIEIFAGVDHIIHAGDVMDPGILDRLATIAPVTAVAGNMDSGEPTSVLPREVVGEVAGVRFLVGHKRKRLLRDLAAGSIAGLGAGEMPDLVIYGHDHVPAAAWVDGTLYLDPGSASAPHEEDDGPTVAIVEVTPAGLSVSFVPLKRRGHEARQRSRQ
jgi:uncharacterized protein